MRWIVKSLLTIAGCALLLLGLGTLVDGPDEVPAVPIEAPVHAALTAADRSAGTVPMEVHRTDPSARQTAAVHDASPLPALPVADRNGTPVRHQAYVRAVWQAFPPEGVFG